MKNTLMAMVELGFSQEEAENQLKELNDILGAMVAKRILEEHSETEQTEEGIKRTIEERYSKEEYLKLFQEVAGEGVKGYFDAITANLTPIRKEEFYKTVALDFQQQG